MTKIAMISPKGAPTMTVYYDQQADTNPYRVYLEWNVLGAHGIQKKRKQVNRYADLASCGQMMSDYGRKNNEEGR